MATYTQETVDLSIALETQRMERSRVEQRIEALITECRDAGMAWNQIGSALHVSAQAAWQRYGLTPEERAAASRQKAPAIEQDTLAGLEPTRAERVAARKVQVKQNRRSATKKD